MAYETKIELLRAEGNCKVFQLSNETGTARMTNWSVFPGITLSYLEAHMQEFTVQTPPLQGVFAINHCEEGRIECNFKNGEYLYMGKGDMSIGRRSSGAYLHTAVFPSAHYHGLSLLVQTEKAQAVLDRHLEDDSFDLEAMCDRFCVDSEFGVIVQEDDAMKHLFYELYHVPQAIRHRYFCLKVLEIFLFLNTMEGTHPDRPYLTRHQAETVKAVAKEITEDLCNHKTIEELAAAYGMAPTSLKHYFKNVYGTTISRYRKEARMAAAMKLLAATTQSILDIANSVGYENSSKFTAAFKKETGFLPKDYRKQQGVATKLS